MKKMLALLLLVLLVLGLPPPAFAQQALGTPGCLTIDQGSQPGTTAAGQQSKLLCSTEGAQFMQQGNPNRWQCSLTGIAATLTECRAAPAAGLRLYVTDITAQSNTATAGTFAIQSGTGTNCGTGTTAVLPKSGTANRYGYPGNASAPAVWNLSVPLVPTAAHAICAIGTVTNTLNLEIGGYIAP